MHAETIPAKCPPNAQETTLPFVPIGGQFARGTVEVQLSPCTYLYVGTGVQRKCAKKFRCSGFEEISEISKGVKWAKGMTGLAQLVVQQLQNRMCQL